MAHRGHVVARRRARPVPPVPGPGRAALTAALRALWDNASDRNLRAAQTAFLLFWAGKWAGGVGIGILAFRDGGALAVGLVGLLSMGPAALVAPFAAPLADRFRREAVLASVALLRAAGYGGVAALVAVGSTAPAYVLIVLVSVAGVLYRPAHSALLPSLCRTAQDLAGANVARGLLDAAGTFLGPLLATVLLGLGQLSGVFVAAALLPAASAACLLLLRYEPTPREEAPRRVRVVADARVALRTVAADPSLRVLFELAAVQTFIRGALTVFVVVLAIDVLGAGEAGAGLLSTAIGAGALAGSLVAALLTGSKRLAVWCGIGTALWGLPLLGVGAVPSLAATAVLLAVVGTGNGPVDIGMFTLPPRLVPDAVLARVFGLLEAVVALGVAIGGLAAPLVIAVLGVRPAAAAVGALAPLAVLAGWRRLRALDAAMLERDGQVAVLAQVPMLRPLPMPAVERIAARLRTVDVPAGTDVVVQGDVAEEFFVVVDGALEVLHDGERVRRLGPGDSFGEVALLRESVRTATVRAREPARLWCVGRGQFLAAVRGFTRSAAEAEALLATLSFVPAPREAARVGTPGGVR